MVQGVGFRPFVYRVAIDHDLKGWVKNSSKGVYIDVEGNRIDINNFIEHLKHQSPPLSKVDDIAIEDKKIVNYKSFQISYSDNNDNAITLISPDISICDECLKDIRDKNNRRYRYPFANCTNCGPRFSIIKKLPYDRATTTMSEFDMCKRCNQEYMDPLDRRFHAQPNACEDCGPKVELMDSFGSKLDCNDPIRQTIQLIKEGKIVAIKGLGGFHIACDAKNEQAIQRLRNRKHRPTKPLALMMKDIDSIKKYCYLSPKEEEVISSNKRPILLLDKIAEKLPSNIAPNSKRLGIMLPYTPLHYLLFEEDVEVLVMTSANAGGLPMVYKNKEALNQLAGFVDYLLVHDREIYIPVDDSISRVTLEQERVFRSARGYSPVYLRGDGNNDILACGSHFKNTFAISKNDNIFISQYIGDIENIETYNNFENNVSHFKDIFNINPKIIAYDRHEGYWSKEYVNANNRQTIAVQHHHAHIVSCMAENKVRDKVIGIAYDGIGYGTDGKIWGSEFMLCDYKAFKRVGHINYVSMPGGDAATKEPWKMAVSYIYKTYGNDIDNYLPPSLKGKNIRPILAMIKNNIHSPKCSSMGRLFDAISAITGFGDKITFEGEAAILLETIANKHAFGSYDYDIEWIDQSYIINTDKIIKGIIKDVNHGLEYDSIAMKFHHTVIDFTIEMCRKIAKEYDINKIALSGGVFQNEILLEGIVKRLNAQGFEVYTHQLIPCNDSGISLGQLMIANAQYKE